MKSALKSDPNQSDSESEDSPEIAEEAIEDELPEIEKTNRSLFWVGTGIFVVIVLFSGVLFYFWSKSGTSAPKVIVETPSAPSPSAIPTASASLNKQSLTFEVQNGSGRSGEAKKGSDKLTALGYKVIKIGNADKSSYKVTQLQLAPELAGLSDQILNDLKTQFPQATISGQLQSSSPSALLIIGKD